MVITDEAIQMDRPSSTQTASEANSAAVRDRHGDRCVRRRGLVALGLVAVVETSGPTRSDQTPEPAPRTRDDIVRDLVARGVVPAATLDDGTHITSPALTPAPRTRDDIVRDLVARGVVPAATLDDGTQIAGPGFEPAPRTRDDIVRDLVARGVVPAATLDDGTQITSPAPEP